MIQMTIDEISSNCEHVWSPLHVRLIEISGKTDYCTKYCGAMRGKDGIVIVDLEG